jgi:hypothetical protein
MKYLSGLATCFLMAVMSAGFYVAAPEAQAAAAKRPASTAASATRARPVTSRSQYRRALSPRQTRANQAARDARRTNGRSATDRWAIALPGSPLSNWTAASQLNQTRAAAPERRQRRSPGGIQVRFRPARPASR